MADKWNFDITQAPKNGTKVLAATKCGKVLTTVWLNTLDRWNFLATGEEPIAWMPYPKHPNELGAQ